MRPIPECFVAVVLVGCFVTAVVVAGEQESSERLCEGPYKDRTPTFEELATVLRNHEAWLAPGGGPNRAILCLANLQGAFLLGADLRGADLFGADLVEANLHEANLIMANLQDANLLSADLQEAVYEPHPGKLPNFWTLAYPRNHLETLVFHRSPAALIALREAFKKGGMRTQERQLTYAIEHTKQLQAWDPWTMERRRLASRNIPVWSSSEQLNKELERMKDTRPWLEKLAGKSESLFSYVLFELPSSYGMVPSRALATLGLLILVCSLVYMVALLTARGRAGIWVTWPTDRVYQEEGAKEATRVTSTFFFPRLQVWAAGHWWGVLLRGVSVPLTGLYFSLLSAFSLGWREFNSAPGSPACSPVSTCCAPPAGCGRCPASNHSSASICWPCGS